MAFQISIVFLLDALALLGQKGCKSAWGGEWPRAIGRATLLPSTRGLARDEALALSPDTRTAHPESTAVSAALTSTDVCTPVSRRERGWRICRMPQ